MAFFVQAWAQTIQCYSEQLRMTASLKLKDIVLSGRLREAFGTSFQSGGGRPASGALAIEDRDPSISAAVGQARREAAQAQSVRDRAANMDWLENHNHNNRFPWGGDGGARHKKGGGKGGSKHRGGGKTGKRKRDRGF